MGGPDRWESFSDEGYLDRPSIEDILSVRGEVHVLERDYRRYVGARIGIHNPAGKKVGKVSHLRNKERIYLVATERGRTLVPDASARLEKLSQPLSAAAC